MSDEPSVKTVDCSQLHDHCEFQTREIDRLRAENERFRRILPQNERDLACLASAVDDARSRAVRAEKALEEIYHEMVAIRREWSDDTQKLEGDHLVSFVKKVRQNAGLPGVPV